MYTDLITKIKNSQRAKKEYLKVPFSNMDSSILDLMQKYGFIESVSKKGRLPKRVLEIKLKYEGGEGYIRGSKFLSKSGRRLYGGYSDLKTVAQGYGLGVISTPKGIMSYNDAKKSKVGGELLFEIW